MNMHKRLLHQYWKKLRAMPVALFLVVGVFFLIVGVFALRANNLRMLELREAVFIADEQNGDVEAALRALREHIYSHMNTSLAASANAIHPPIQLKHQYERLVAAEKERVENINAKVYTKAQQYCEKLYPNDFSGRVRVPCAREYVQEHGTSERPIEEALYKFDFVSPAWSPDLAGWSLALAILSFLLAALLFITERWLHHYLHRHA